MCIPKSVRNLGLQTMVVECLALLTDDAFVAFRGHDGSVLAALGLTPTFGYRSPGRNVASHPMGLLTAILSGHF